MGILSLQVGLGLSLVRIGNEDAGNRQKRVEKSKKGDVSRLGQTVRETWARCMFLVDGPGRTTTLGRVGQLMSGRTWIESGAQHAQTGRRLLSSSVPWPREAAVTNERTITIEANSTVVVRRRGGNEGRADQVLTRSKDVVCRKNFKWHLKEGWERIVRRRGAFRSVSSDCQTQSAEQRPGGKKSECEREREAERQRGRERGTSTGKHHRHH